MSDTFNVTFTETDTVFNVEFIEAQYSEGGGGSFSGDMDDIENGTTYVKTENNFTD